MTQAPVPVQARSARTGMPWRSQIRMIRWMRGAVRSWVRPGRAGEVHGRFPSGSVAACTFTPCRRCLAE
ncbi:hypothetical protein VT52_007430 [Streptomyces malaysiense]|uniref:Uncharacterized protein n=1 Tax=Streptomyces malaysiense TaxID=1428626 RepID=A0A1J4Q8P6_9ACTN|nr:hypothetical protein VT52_007430 [Streptomyces malaysiense]